MFYATHRLIDSVWTLGYEKVSENEIRIISYDRDNPVGYKEEKNLPRIRIVEDEDRTVTDVIIDDFNAKSLSSLASFKSNMYKVVNPNHVFSYREVN
jgi:hypothetical protein